MNRQMVPLMLATVIALATTQGSFAAEFCSLSVNVKRPDGGPVAGVRVQATEIPSRRVLSGVSDANGKARICDLSVFPVRIQAGSMGCLIVDVNHFIISWGPNEATLTFDEMRDPCRADPPYPGYCHLVLRVTESSGKPIPDAKIQPKGAVKGQNATDEFGRALLLPGLETRAQGAITARGFKPASFDVRCGYPNDKLEERIVLISESTP